jgi:hypothetical protein
MAFEDILITNEKKQAIKDKGADKMPLNPTAQGYSGQQVRAALAAAVTGNQDSVLAELDSKLSVIKGHFESSVGNVSILDALPQDLTPYNERFIFIKNDQGVVTNVYYITNGTANEARFTTSNVTVSEEEPQQKILNDVWFDI